MSKEIKVRDRVRVLRNRVFANKPFLAGPLVPGDEIVVLNIVEVEDRSRDGYHLSAQYRTSNSSTNSIPLTDVELITTDCTCDIFSLMNYGCKCGAINRE